MSGSLAAKEIHCFSEVKFADEGSLQMTVDMRIEHGRLSMIELSHLTLVYGTKTGYQCEARFVSNEPTNTWRFNGSKTEISSAGETPEESTHLLIEHGARAYRLKTKNLSTAECGARAQWPESVVVPESGGRCRTKY
jgi:hypothetical protein